MPTPTDKSTELAATVAAHRAELHLLALGADALQGLEAMMQPEMNGGGEQLNQMRRSDMVAIFLFFGESLRASAGRARNHTEYLKMISDRSRVALKLEEAQA